MSNCNESQDYEKARYAFLAELGRPALDMLRAQAGEKILDLGCENGAITKEIVNAGCIVKGLDLSPAAVQAALGANIDAKVYDGKNIGENEEFDAVFSNSEIHKLSDHYGIVRSVWRALKGGGRFVAECGGSGCIRVIREGMKIALIKRGIDYKSRVPWKYPELGTFSDILENQGFKVGYIARIAKPIPLTGGLKGWLASFAGSYTEGLSCDDTERFYAEVEDYCRPVLYTQENGWIADYVSLRFLATKPEQGN